MRKFAESVLKYKPVVIVLALAIVMFGGYGAISAQLNPEVSPALPHGAIVDLWARIGAADLSAITEPGILTALGIGLVLLATVTFLPVLWRYLPDPVKTRGLSARHANLGGVASRDLAGMRESRQKTTDTPGALTQVAAIVQRCYHLAGVSALAGVEDYTEGIYDGDPQTDYHAAQRRQHDYLLDEVGAGPGFRLLEIGCGLGTLMLAAKARRCEVTGVTISEDQQAVCRARGLQVVLSDYRALPKQWAGAFDGIVVNGALEHFCQPSDALDGQQDRIYKTMFGILSGLLDPCSPSRRVVTTALHFRGAPVAPLKLLGSPLRQVFDQQAFHFAVLHRGYGGYYPTAGQLERCAHGLFRLAREVDGTQDYGFTADDWLRMFRSALHRRFGAALFQHFVHDPAHTLWFTASFLGPASQLWQFRGTPTPVQHFRHTWEAIAS